MTGRALPPTSRYAGDDGTADPRLAVALAADPLSLPDVVSVLGSARVLVPVLAQVDATDATGTIDTEASAGIVALRIHDGRTALPIFSSVAAMAAWRGSARPVPTDGARAAAAALGEGWEVLVLDPSGPVTVLIGRPAVIALAHAEPWRPAVADGVVDDEVGSAVAAALAGVIHVAGVDVAPGRRAEVAVALAVRSGLDRAGLDAVLANVNAALAANAVVAARVDSLEVRVATAR